MRPKLVIGGSPPCRGASVTSAQMDREACNAEVRAVRAIPFDTRSPLLRYQAYVSLVRPTRHGLSTRIRQAARPMMRNNLLKWPMRKKEFFCQAPRILTKLMPDTLVSILWRCAPEACLLVGFDWPRTDSSIRYSSQLFTAPTSIMLVPGSAWLRLHSYSDHLQDFGCATLGKSLALLFGEVHAQLHRLRKRFLALSKALPSQISQLGEKDQQDQLWTLRCAFARYYTIA